MTDLVRVKRGRHPWVTEPESGGGGGGSEDLATVLSNGNDGGGQQIVNIADGSNPTDAATVQQVDGAYTQGLADILANSNQAGNTQIKNIADGTDPQDAASVAQLGSVSVPGLSAVLAVSQSAGSHDIADVQNLDADSITVQGGDGTTIQVFVQPPPGATAPAALIGPSNLGLEVDANGSVQMKADPNDAVSLVSMQRGSDAIYIDEDGIHITGLINGGGQFSAVYVYNFDQTVLAAGQALFTPAVEELITVSCVVPVTFDGTTPKMDVGQGVANGDGGIFAASNTGVIDLTVPSANVGAAIEVVASENQWLLSSGLDFQIWISQDGKKNGAATGATDGVGTVYVTRTPTGNP